MHTVRGGFSRKTSYFPTPHPGRQLSLPKCARPQTEAHVCAEASRHPGCNTLNAKPLDRSGDRHGGGHRPLASRIPPGPLSQWPTPGPHPPSHPASLVPLICQGPELPTRSARAFPGLLPIAPRGDTWHMTVTAFVEHTTVLKGQAHNLSFHPGPREGDWCPACR